MSTHFAEADHPRANDGKFAAKHQSEADDVSLTGPSTGPTVADQAAEAAKAMHLVAGDMGYREVDAYVREADAGPVVAKFYQEGEGDRWGCYGVDGDPNATDDVAGRLEMTAIDGEWLRARTGTVVGEDPSPLGRPELHVHLGGDRRLDASETRRAAVRASDLARRVEESTSMDVLGERLHEIYDTDDEIVVQLRQDTYDDGDHYWRLHNLSVGGRDPADDTDPWHNQLEADNAVIDEVALVDFYVTADERVRRDEHGAINLVL